MFSLFCAFAIFSCLAQNKAQSTGGGFVESKSEVVANPLSEDAAAVMTFEDSTAIFPAHDVYRKWDNVNIHAYDFSYKELKDTVQIVMRREACDYDTPFLGRITSNFGDRGARYHYGIDIKLYKGDPVKTAFEGLIRISQYSRTYGNVVVVRHQNGLETLYAHLSARKVKEGDHVEAGSVIGLGGNTGRSTGSHLHFECRYQGEPIDPNTIINWVSGELAVDTMNLNAAHFAYLKEARSKKYHTIRSGDTISGIASKYSTYTSTICRLNGISRNSTIYVGKRLRVR